MAPARTTKQIIDALAAELTVFGREEARRADDQLDALVWAFYAPGVKPPWPPNDNEPGSGMFAGLGGELDFGIVRDSSIRSNSTEVFLEQWQALRPPPDYRDIPPQV